MEAVSLMTADRAITIRNSQAEIHDLASGLDRQITHLRREIAEKSQDLQELVKVRALLPDYERLMVGELSGAANR